MRKTGYRAYREKQPLRTIGSETNQNGLVAKAFVGGEGGAGGLAAGQSLVSPPKFYSPLHTPSNWQLPTKRREVYTWCRFFANNEPKVAAALDFYSQFPVTDFENVCDDIKVKKYYDELKRRLRLSHVSKLIAYEYYCMGDVFAFADIYCPVCGGAGYIPDAVDAETNQPVLCPHQNGTFTNVTILNPDWIEVQSSYINQDSEVMVMLPDNNLRSIVSRKAPKELYDRIPEQMRGLILQGRPIPLHPMCVSHLAYNRCGYQPYGRSLIMRLFRTLAYKDKIVQANWIIADRHILPIRVVKVGSESLPAGPQDIAAIQSQLFAASSETNVTLIVPHAFDLEYVGASGKVLQLSKEYDMIDQELLDGLMINKSLLNGEGPNFCHSDDTEFLTNSGWKHYKDISANETLGTFNRDNGALEYQPYLNRWEFDYDSDKTGDMFHFTSSKLDCLVTPNHNMLVLPRQDCKPISEKGKWELTQAKDIKPRSQLRGCIENWEEGRMPELQLPDGMTFDDYLELGCYYVTEGWLGRSAKNYKRQAHAVNICQSLKNVDVHEAMTQLLLRNDASIYTYEKNNATTFRFAGKEIQDKMFADFGEYSYHKKLPQWMKNLPTPYLKRVLKYLVACDGNTRAFRKGVNISDGKYYSFFSISKQLVDDVQEIALKCGYAPKIVQRPPVKERSPIYSVYFTDAKFGKYPTIEETDGKTKVKRLPYQGKVVCFETPNHTLVTRRNGKIIITGNSNASIGIEAMIQRLEALRETIAEWIEERIYRPVAIMNGWTEEDERGMIVPLYPRIKWKELKLRDDSQRKNLLMQLNEKGKVSNQTLLEYFNLDPDTEIERMRLESVRAQELGLAPAGAGGGGGGGLGDLGGGGGGGGGGGMPPMPDMGGAPPAGGGMDAGGAVPAGGAPPAAGGAGGAPQMSRPATEPNVWMPVKRPLVSRHPRVSKHQEEEEEIQPVPRVVLTRPEQKYYQMLHGAYQKNQIIHPCVPQYRPDPVRRFTIDFAFPTLKLGIEIEGKVWHSNQEQIARDLERDTFLGKQGWVIWRFTEKEISNHLEDKVYPETMRLISNREKQLGVK